MIEGLPKDAVEMFSKTVDVSAKELHEVMALPEGSYCLVGQIQGSVRAMQQASIRTSVCSITDGSTLSTNKAKLGNRHGVSCSVPIEIPADSELHVQLRSLSVLHTKLRAVLTLYKLPASSCAVVQDAILVRVPKLRRSWSHIHHLSELVRRRPAGVPLVVLSLPLPPHECRYTDATYHAAGIRRAPANRRHALDAVH